MSAYNGSTSGSCHKGISELRNSLTLLKRSLTELDSERMELARNLKAVEKAAKDISADLSRVSNTEKLISNGVLECENGIADFEKCLAGGRIETVAIAPVRETYKRPEPVRQTASYQARSQVRTPEPRRQEPVRRAAYSYAQDDDCGC